MPRQKPRQKPTHGPSTPVRSQLYAIVGIAFVSLLGSYALYHSSKDGSGWGTTNNGAFVSPARTVQSLGWRISGDVAVELDHWWIWHVSVGCDSRCQVANRDLSALHLRLHKDAARVRRGFTDLTGNPSQDGLNLSEGLRPIDLDGAPVEVGIYVVDPIGNLVFYYPQDTEPRLILDDLKRLLKVSQIG